MPNLVQIFVLSLCICLCGCGTIHSAPDQETSIRTNDVAYIHPASKFLFPKHIDNFKFVGVTKYDREEKDVGVGYDSPTPVVATVYVYPAAKNLALLPQPRLTDVSQDLINHEFESRKREIHYVHPDAILLSEGPCELVQGDKHFRGKKAVFSFSQSFGFFKTRASSELYIFLIEPSLMFLVNDRQYVEYRITCPGLLNDKIETEINSFMSKLAWPAK